MSRNTKTECYGMFRIEDYGTVKLKSGVNVANKGLCALTPVYLSFSFLLPLSHTGLLSVF